MNKNQSITICDITDLSSKFNEKKSLFLLSNPLKITWESLRIFSVYISLLISRVRPVHSFFEKKSILENSSQIFTNLFFNAY